MDAKKKKKPLEGERSFSNSPIHIMTLNFRRSLSSNPRPVACHYFSSNPLFRSPFLGPLSRPSFSPNRLFQPPFLAPNFGDSASSNPLFRPPHYFMDLVNNQTKFKNRVKMAKAKMVKYAGYIQQGENMVKRFLSISHENYQPVMILSGNGMISSVKVLGTTGVISYEGPFEIKQLHGSIDRVTGSINLWLEFIMNDSSVISGIVMGPLIAASRIQVIYALLVQYPLNNPNLSLEDGESEDGESGDSESENGESGDDESENGESENGESGDDESENGEST